MSISIHPNLKQLSHSSNNTLHGCPRKFELSKLSPQFGIDHDAFGDIHLDFGKVLGEAIQVLFVTDSIEAAYMTAFRAWKNMLDDEAGAVAKKTFWHILFALDKFIFIRKTVFSKFKVAILNGRPATELGFSIDCGDGFAYRGYVDVVMRHIEKPVLAVFECKSTKSYNVDEAVFRNSGQALGYSVVLDAVAPLLDIPMESDFDVYYPVYKTYPLDWEVLRFKKNALQRARWIKNVLVDKKHVIEFCEDDYFPIHGEHCFSFFRQCPYLGTCEMDNKYIVGSAELIEERAEEESKYDYHFKLTDIITRQLTKLGEE